MPVTRKTSIAVALLSLGLHALSSHAQQATAPVAASDVVAAKSERRSGLEDQQSAAITIYNEDQALVKETRSVVLDGGLNRLALRDVSARMRPETAQLRSLSHPGSFELLEQNFDFDLLTPAKLLEKYVGRSVRVVKTHPTTGAETVESAQVLGANGGVVLKMGDRIETGIPGRVVFDGVPTNLRDRPTLVTELNNKRPGPQTLELSYLTAGLSWHADYVAELNADDSELDLSGWVTLTNRSGTAYPNAKLQLVAGDVNRVTDEAQRDGGTTGIPIPAALTKAAVVQEALFEYHLYTLNRPTTLADNQTKQVSLLHAVGVTVKKELILQGGDYYYRAAAGEIGQKIKAAVYVEIANRESAHLGMPLPRGIVRVYKRDSAGNAQFVGEDRIDHTSKNEKASLHLGDAFDVTADKKQTDFRRREPTNKASYVFESAYEIVVRNAKSEAVRVTVREPIGGDWMVMEESHPHVKLAAGTVDWHVNVPAGGSTTLKYRVLVRD